MARLFVEWAVARRDLARSYNLVTLTLRQGISRYPRPKSTVRSGPFSLSLVRDGGRWLVSAWSARSVVGAPARK